MQSPCNRVNLISVHAPFVTNQSACTHKPKCAHNSVGQLAHCHSDADAATATDGSGQSDGIPGQLYWKCVCRCRRCCFRTPHQRMSNWPHSLRVGACLADGIECASVRRFSVNCIIEYLCGTVVSARNAAAAIVLQHLGAHKLV